MTKTPKRTGGPTTAKGKAISSAITQGLTSKRWLNDDEQSLYEITVETALYELAQAQAENPSRVIESYESDNPNLEKEVADALHRHNTINKRTFDDPLTLYQELTEIELSDISGWQYVMDEMPETYLYIMKQCRWQTRQEGDDR